MSKKPHQRTLSHGRKEELEAEVIFACGQVLLRHLLPQETFPTPPRLLALTHSQPGFLAGAAVFTRRQVERVFAPQGPEEAPSPSGLALAVLRGLSRPPCSLLRQVGVGDGDEQAVALFAILAADLVLGEGRPPARMRDFLALFDLPALRWPGAAKRLAALSEKRTPSFAFAPLGPGETVLDLTASLTDQTMRILGLEPPVPGLRREKLPRPSPASPAPIPRAPSTADPPVVPVCALEPLGNLSGDAVLILDFDLKDELDYVTALCRRTLAPPLPRLLFHGPPGTGKTHAARVLARDLGRPLAVAKAGGLLQKYVGDGERAIAQAFEEASAAGAVLLLDEADSYLGDRRNADHSWEVTRVNALLVQLEQAPVPTILCTNYLDSLDEAVHRRMDHLIEFPIPAEWARMLMWFFELKDAGIPIQGLDIESISAVPLTGGLIRNAATQAGRRKLVKGDSFVLDTASLLVLARAEEKKLGALAKGRRAVGFGAPAAEEGT